MLFATAEPIVHLPLNSQGKDYVIGDLHGCRTLLDRLLESVDFNPQLDRLFAVGDLIDRGPDSPACLELLNQPWFHAVQGNHERMLQDFFQGYLAGEPINDLADDAMGGFLWNGGEWVEAFYDIERQAMSSLFDRWLKMVAQLPLLIIVGEGARRFHITHAELAKPPFREGDSVWLDADIDQWRQQNLIPDHARESLLWARALIGKLERASLAAVQPGLSPTYCGHTFDKRPRQGLSHIYLDTGAFISSSARTYWQDGEFGLTIYDINENRWQQASYQHTELVTGQLRFT